MVRPAVEHDAQSTDSGTKHLFAHDGSSALPQLKTTEENAGSLRRSSKVNQSSVNDIMKTVMEDPKIRSAAHSRTETNDIIQSISDLTPIIERHIKDAQRRIMETSRATSDMGNALRPSKEPHSSVTTTAVQPTTEHINTDFDVPSTVVEGVLLIKESDVEGIQKEWLECMEKAKRLIDQARKMRRPS
ncbi:hypothetical protein FGB62_66g151 [Gracilaria domingensis]|nr:hypothetical protein FGB62_66g151 [Gracilaria domingensis]